MGEDRSYTDGTAPQRRRARELMPAMLAMIRERGPIDHLAALHHLKAEGRVKPGIRVGVALAACCLLEREGLVERVGAHDWQVPSDSAVIISEHEHGDGEPAAASRLAA